MFGVANLIVAVLGVSVFCIDGDRGPMVRPYIEIDHA